MINAIFVFNGRGDLLVCKLIKDHVKRSLSEVFRTQVINDNNVRSPILTLGSTTFHHIRRENGPEPPLWVVAVSRSNVDSAMVWEYLHKFYDLMVVFGISDEESLKEDFMLCYELLDITLENGFPQTTDLAQILPRFSKQPVVSSSNSNSVHLDELLTSANILRAPKQVRRSSSSIALASLPECPWRPMGLKFKKNEVYLDIHEKINILVGKDGSILKSYVNGSIDCSNHLSGMPICQLGLNDSDSRGSFSDLSLSTLMSEYDIKNEKAIPKAAAGSVKLEDCKFHQCVQLAKYQADHIIRFVPPDGSFQLMQYCVKEDINIPFNVIPIVESFRKTMVKYKITLKSLFPPNVIAKNVIVKVPVPPSTINSDINVSAGKCKYDPTESAMIWKFSKYNGSTENSIISTISLPASSDDISDFQRWTKPPITLKFEIVMFSNSGLVVRHFKCQEPDLDYQPVKWIKYISHSGSYEIRY